MLNQVLLKGTVLEINEDDITIVMSNDVIKIHDVPKEMIQSILLNNVVAINGHLEMRDEITVVCDRIIILDSRGRKNP